ncbi:hypothetical protein [Methylorubrum aminovorans]
MIKIPNVSGTKAMRSVLQHVNVTTSNQSGEEKGNRMGGLDANWLSADLALVDADFNAWSQGLKESYDSLYGDAEQSRAFDASSLESDEAERV